MKTNHIELTGFTGKDIKVVTAKTKKYARISLAVNNSYKSGEEWVKQTNWFNIIVWGDKETAKLRKIKKGTKLSVAGRININNYNEKQYFEVVASSVSIAK